MSRFKRLLHKLFKIEPCPKSDWGHQWNYSFRWNSGKVSRFTGDVMGRGGSRCYHCGEMRWDETEEEYAEAIRNVVVTEPAKH